MPHSETAYNVEVETVQAKEMAKIAYHALDEKKGEDIRIIDIAGISVLADYFIIANGSSESQVQAMVDNVEEEMHKAGYSLKQREGYGSGNWVLLDFGDVIVHVFDKENRLFYDDNVEEEMHKAGYSLKQREGYGSGNWVLLDFGDVIVHVFDKENRLFYDLERIWRDGKNIEITELS